MVARLPPLGYLSVPQRPNIGRVPLAGSRGLCVAIFIYFSCKRGPNANQATVGRGGGACPRGSCRAAPGAARASASPTIAEDTPSGPSSSAASPGAACFLRVPAPGWSHPPRGLCSAGSRSVVPRACLWYQIVGLTDGALHSCVSADSAAAPSPSPDQVPRARRRCHVPRAT